MKTLGLILGALLWVSPGRAAMPPLNPQSLGVPTPYRANNIAGLVTWVTSATLPAGAVATWPSLGSPAASFYTTNAPTVGGTPLAGKATLTFDGTANFMTNNFAALSQCTLFIVFRCRTVADVKFLCDGIDENRFAFYRASASASFAVSCGTIVNLFPADNLWHVLMLSVNGAASTWMTNATLETTYTNSPGTLNLTGLTLGARYNLGATYFGNYDIAEIRLYSRANLTPAEKSWTMADLQRAWGL